MSVEVEYWVTQPEHLEELMVRMREDDRRECEALGGVRQQVFQARDVSDFCLSAFVGDELMCCFGIVEHKANGRDGHVPWLLTTDTVERYPKSFYAEAKRIAERLMRYYPHLVQIVDARYERACAFMEHLGFEPTGIFPAGQNGESFIVYEYWRA